MGQAGSEAGVLVLSLCLSLLLCSASQGSRPHWAAMKSPLAPGYHVTSVRPTQSSHWPEGPHWTIAEIGQALAKDRGTGILGDLLNVSGVKGQQDPPSSAPWPSLLLTPPWVPRAGSAQLSRILE